MASDSSPSPDVVEVVAANDGEVATNASQRESKAKTKRKRETISTSTATSKASRERSWVWDHFTKYDEPLIEIVNNEEKVVGHTRRAQCKYCSTNLACDSRGNGTSSLSKHIEQVCKGYPGRANLEEDQQVFTNDGKETPSVVMRSWTQENCVEAACVMIVMDELPFSFIEKPGFRYFCSVAVPRFNVPCRKVIVKNFLRMYNAKKEELKRELQSHCVCLTTDTWTSCQNINYMVITAHFIDCGWKMHKRVLNFCVIPNHQGNTIGKILENCLVEWSIENLLTVSVDNASANTVAIDYLRKKMMTWEKKPIFAGKYMHVRCLAHIVNLIVRSGLAILEKSVASIRNAVKYVRSSSSRLDVFKKCVAKEKLESKKICVLDVPTRWNSTFIMLDTALELRKAFDRMAEEEEAKYYNYFDEDEELEEDEEETEIDWENWNHPKVSRKRVGPPIETDWAAALVFVKFLKVFYDVTVRVSASLHPTSSNAFHDIVSIKAELEELYNKPVDNNSSESDKILYGMAVKMKAKYRKYFGKLEDMNQLFAVALILDPRYKLGNFNRVCQIILKLSSSEIVKKSEEVKNLLINLCDLYSLSLGNQSAQKARTAKNDSSSTLRVVSSNATSSTVSGKMAEILADWDRELEEGDQAVVGHEVDRYLLDPIEKPPKGSNFKILDWWKVNGPKYPSLQVVAKDILAIQVSTVASESSFSTGKRVIDPHRSSLTPKTVEALICLQNWLRSDSIMGLEYIPTIEEMQFFEEIEKEQAQEDIERNENATASTAAVAEKVADSAGPSKPKTVKAMKKKNKRLGAVNL